MINLALQEFFVEGGDQKASHVLLHLTEPDTPEEKEKGYFFAIVEINKGSLELIEKIQKIIEEIETGYFETSLSENKDSFEQVLEFINRKNLDILFNDKTELNCIVGVIKNDVIFISFHGQPHALLFYQNKEETKTLDILKDAKKEAQNSQLFSSMLQGKISAGDFLFVGTPHITEYFTYDRLQKIISSRAITQSAAHIQKVLSDISSNNSFGGIIFHANAKKNLKPVDLNTTYPNKSEQSLNYLIDSRQKTAETLSPPLVKQIMRNIRETMQKRKDQKARASENIHAQRQSETIETRQARKIVQQEKTLINDMLIGAGRILVECFKILYKSVKFIGIWTGKACIALFIIITNKNNSRHDVLNSIKKAIDSKKNKFEDLPIISKLLFFAALILSLLFAGSIAIIKTKEYFVNKKAAYNNLIQDITNKKDMAEASLIYNDQEKAFALLKEAETLLKTAPTNSKSKQKTFDELNASISKTMLALRKIITVDPEMLVDLKTINPETSAEKIAKIENKLITFGENDKNIYIYDIDTKKTDLSPHLDSIKLNSGSTTKEQDSIIFINNKNSSAVFNKETNTISAKEISFPNEDANIVDDFVYNGKLYTLDSKNNKIYRHNKIQTGYEKGSEWTKETADFSDAVSLAIDGDMFVAKQNGEIIKFAQGLKQDFSLIGVDPAISKPVKILTHADINEIYILEAGDRRVISLEKSGKLIKQYTSDKWQNPTGMIIDYEKKIAYIVDQNKIYKFGL
jgi:hypothetical protein